MRLLALPVDSVRTTFRSHLYGRRDMGPSVCLTIHADDVDYAKWADGPWDEVRLQPKEEGMFIGSDSGQENYPDGEVASDHLVDRIFDSISELDRDAGKLEIKRPSPGDMLPPVT